MIEFREWLEVNGIGVCAALVTGYFFFTRLLPLNNAIVGYYHPRLPVAHTITSYSFVDHGLAAYTFTTFAESSGGLHLFALLNVPSVLILGPTGTRVTASVLTGLTVVVTYAIARRRYDVRTALLAAAILTVSPMFQFFATAGFPEAFELLASAAAVYAFVRYRDSGTTAWVIGSIVLLFLGIADHAWAALAFGPIAVISLVNRRWELVSVYGAATAAGVGLVYYITNIRGSGSTLQAYSVFSRPGPLLDPTFYFEFTYNGIGFALSPILGPVVILLALWFFIRRKHLLVATWTLAGLSPVLLFPRGASIHFYYLWGFLVPGSILAAVAASEFADWVTTHFDRPQVTPDRAYSVWAAGALAFVLVASLVVGPVGVILPPPDGADRLTEANCVKEAMIENGINSEDVAIVTTLQAIKKEESSTIYLHTYLMYGRLYMKAPNSPGVYDTKAEARAAAPLLIIDFKRTYVATQTSDGPSPAVLVREDEEYVRVCEG